jgi:uncharacterized protein YjbI with pentapeptide repeats
MPQPLWYLRFEGRIVGPYPPSQIREWLRDGSITPQWEISLDERDWLSIEASHQFRVEQPQGAPAGGLEALVWRKERERARERWLKDEGRLETAQIQNPDQAERARQALEQDHARTDALIRKESGRHPGWGLAFIGALLLAALGYGVWRWQQPDLGVSIGKGLHLRSGADCTASAAEQVSWVGCDKSGTQLRGQQLRRARLDGARLDGAVLAGADLTDAVLRGASLRNADLTGAVLTGADLGGADLSGANLTQARLDYAVLRDAQMAGVRLDGARLGHAIWPNGHACPDDAVGACP